MWVWIVAAVVVVDTLFAVFIIRYVIRGNWNTIADRYPERPPAESAVHRAYQSFKLGILNLGYSVHVSADDDHLHLAPVKPLRWLGAKSASIPWTAITIVKRRRNGRWTTARIAPSTTISGPAWCLDLADPGSPGD